MTNFILGVYFLSRQWCSSTAYNTQEAACASSKTEVIKHAVKRHPEVSTFMCCCKIKTQFSLE